MPPTQEFLVTGSGGVPLHGRSWLPDGEPRDVVVIAHGYAEHGERYANVVEKLVPLGYAVYAIDHRGHGRSGGRRGMIGRMAWVIEDLHSFIEKVRAIHHGRAVKLLGHSMGGSVAFGYALRFPESLSGLILSGPAIGGLVAPFQRFLMRVFSAIAPNVGTIELPSDAICRDPAVVAAYTADPLVTIGRVPARTVGEMIASARDYLPKAPMLRIPVLIQHGSQDLLIPFEGNREIYAAIGSDDKSIIPYEGLSHEIYNEPEKDRVLEDLLTWLDAHQVA